MSTVFRAIADPARREILDSLSVGEESVTELARAFSMTLPAVSQHLRVLQHVARWIHPYQRFWQAKLVALANHLRRRHGPNRR
jgi:DNA-binding transcriptional ArsR family regulator